MTKKILYVHGLASTRNSNTPKNLRKHLPGIAAGNAAGAPDVLVDSFDVPFDPKEAAEFVRKKSAEYDMVIGSSLGGFYAQFAQADIPKIIINPALQAARNIYEISGYGIYDYFGPREDGVQQFETTPEYYEALKVCQHEMEENLTDTAKANTYIIFGRQDETLGDVNVAFAREMYGEERTVFVDMLHQLSEEVVADTVKPLVRKIFGKITDRNVTEE